MLIFAALVAASLAPSRKAHALTFNFVPAPGMSAQAIDGFNAAGLRWSSLFSDDVTININVDFVPLGGGVLGSTGSSQTNYTYTNTRAAMVGDVVSADDTTATSFLPAAPAPGVFINYTSDNPAGAGSPTPSFDNDAGGNNSTVRMHHANAKALGLRSATNSASDASITFSSSFAWDFNPFDGITSGAYDYVGIAAHEIGHALGFSSGVDLLDTSSPGSGGTFLAEDGVFTKTLDLFRYSTNSRAAGVGVFDMSADARSKYFSINGGTTNLATFSTGRNKGDGQQAGHWKDNLNLGIMDPTASSGSTLLISALDRRALDVIGWNPGNTWQWVDPGGGNFTSALRWSSNATPQAGQEAVWNLNSTYTVFFASAQTTASAQVRAGAVTFNLGATSYNAGATLNVAPNVGETATLDLTSGAVSASVVNLGGVSAAAGGTGILTVNSGSTISAPGKLRIWPGGTLKLNAAAISAGQIQLNGGTIQSVSGGAIAAPIVSSGGTAQVDAGAFTLNGALTTSGGTLNKTGAGTLVIAGAQSHAAGAVLQTSAGTTTINTNAGSIAAPGALAVIANATTYFQSTQNLKSLVVGPGATAALATGGTRSIKTTTISVDTAGGGKLDLKDNRLVVDYIGPSSMASVNSLLMSGCNAGAWDGPGINSSAAGSSGLYALGSGEAKDILDISGLQTASWGGQTIDATAVIVRYTYAGDANLDGFISGDDYSSIDFNVSTPGASGYWNGDFNYDGIISGDDYSTIDFNIGAQGAPFPASNSLAAPITAVPEPAACAFASAAAVALLMRRRRDR
jgi:autotransporter-associated beta strand protein